MQTTLNLLHMQEHTSCYMCKKHWSCYICRNEDPSLERTLQNWKSKPLPKVHLTTWSIQIFFQAPLKKLETFFNLNHNIKVKTIHTGTQCLSVIVQRHKVVRRRCSSVVSKFHLSKEHSCIIFYSTDWGSWRAAAEEGPPGEEGQAISGG